MDFWTTRVSKIASMIPWDVVNGIGAVPWNQEVEYRGFVKQMTPVEFRALVPSGSWGNKGEEFADLIRQGKSFAPPFLEVEWEGDHWQVIDHEGRSRSDASRKLEGPNFPMPVHIFPRGLRARDLTDEMRNAPFNAQA